MTDDETDDGDAEPDTAAVGDPDAGSPPTVADRPPRAAAVDDAATSVRDSAPSLRAKPVITAPSESSTTIGSPLDALARDEVMRTRRFALIGLTLSATGFTVIPLLPGDPFATRLLVGSIAVAVVGMAYLLWRTRDAVRISGWAVALAWYLPALSTTATIPYFGSFSPAPILLVLGIYFTGLGASLTLAIAIYVSTAAVQAVTAGLVIAGITRDTGVVHAAGLTVENAIIVQVLVQLVMGATFFIARVSRRTALIAVTELESAVRAVAHREALLDEARDELERALKSNRGRGRFSDQTIGGDKLGGAIGRGAMGEVYDASSITASSEPAAIKLLAQTSLGNANHVRRFLRELKAAAAIDAPNVVRVIAVGESPVPYLVMEKLDGKDLSDTLRGRRRLEPAQVTDLVRQVGAGITAAGAAGIVHRDLKPQNLIDHHGTWKILDFGVSRLADHGDTLTAGHVVGTPAYMAPEQARGGAVDHRTDLYALAAIAYRALTGQPPYSGREVATTLYRVVHGAPARPSALIELPDDVDLVLAIGLAKDPADRFATAADFADALAAALDGRLSARLRDRGRVLDRNAWTT